MLHCIVLCCVVLCCVVLCCVVLCCVVLCCSEPFGPQWLILQFVLLQPIFMSEETEDNVISIPAKVPTSAGSSKRPPKRDISDLDNYDFAPFFPEIPAFMDFESWWMEGKVKRYMCAIFYPKKEIFEILLDDSKVPLKVCPVLVPSRAPATAYARTQYCPTLALCSCPCPCSFAPLLLCSNSCHLPSCPSPIPVMPALTDMPWHDFTSVFTNE